MEKKQNVIVKMNIKKLKKLNDKVKRLSIYACCMLCKYTPCNYQNRCAQRITTVFIGIAFINSKLK